MIRFCALMLIGCTAARSPQAAVEPAKPIAVTPVADRAPDLDEAQVKARSHAWFDAYDRHDVATVTDVLGPAFIQFEEGRYYDKALITKYLTGRKDRHMPITTRTWKQERVVVGGNSAVFIGLAAEHVAAFEDNPAHDIEGYNTLVWTREGSRWLITHWQWALAGIDAERNRWNEIFRNASGFNKKPNQLLVDTVKSKKPGTALDVAMGQGRNALYLAAHGWKTTGVDISDEGLEQAKAEASKQKLKLDTVLADTTKYDFGVAKWDLVTLIYAGDDAKLVERIKPSIRKGGLFVCEYFHADSEIANAGAGGWDTGELAALFKDGFDIIKDEVVEDNADWAGQRKTKLVRFVARKR